MELISLAPSNTEVLCELGAYEQIVATTSLCDYPDGVRKLPSVGGWTEGIDFEKIESLDPDLVLTSDRLQEEVLKELESRKIPSLHVEPTTPEEVYESILTIGEAIGEKEAAEDLAENMREEIESIELGGARIYCEEWMNPPMVSGNWVPGLVKKAGGEYMISEGARSSEVSLEEVRKFDPEYIFLNVCGAGRNVNVHDIKEREGWSSLTAFRKGNVYVVDDALLNRPGPRLVEGISLIESYVS
ncbi:MAG: cobalamin-binding protein [Candidatus Nanohaloarchaea archaeon]